MNVIGSFLIGFGLGGMLALVIHPYYLKFKATLLKIFTEEKKVIAGTNGDKTT
jgi:hypothetical protein